MGAAWPASTRLPKPFRLKTILENLAVSDAESFYRDLIWLRGDVRESLYSNDFMQALQGFTPMGLVGPLYVQNDAMDALGRSQFADIHFYMTDDVLVKVDRMSMAHSLEVRSPLLDHRVIEFAARLPANLKLNSRIGKAVPRALLSRRLASDISKKPKRGFSIPAREWLSNELRPFAEDLILNKSRIVADVLDKQKVREIWREHLGGSRDHSVFIWGLMMLGLWEGNAKVGAQPM